METTSLPSHVIESHLQAVEDSAIRAKLQHHLGLLAETAVPFDATELGERLISPVTIEQTEMIAGYFARASQELGPDTSEASTWYRVFYDQLADLKNPDSGVDPEVLATNILIGNLLATYGQEPQLIQLEMRSRMWDLASSRKGLTILKAAENNLGLCVATGNWQEPYNSIIEQTREYEGLFLATDEAVDLGEVNMPVHALETADPRNQAWFISLMANNGNFESARRNLEFVEDKKALCDELLWAKDFKLNFLKPLGLSDVMSLDGVIDKRIKDGHNFFRLIDMGSLSKDEQVSIFNRIIDNNSDAMVNLFYAGDGEGFDKLGIDELNKLKELGYITGTQSVDLSIFNNLPQGTLQQLRESGVTDYYICKSLKSFDIEDRRALYDELINGTDEYYVYDNLDQFDFIDKKELIEVARNKGRMFNVASHVEGFTDGSDKELLIELIEANQIDAIGLKLDKLPNIDIDWFIEMAEEKGALRSLINCLPFTDKLDQNEIFEKALSQQNPDNWLGYQLQKFTQLDTHIALQRLIEAKQYKTIISHIEYFQGEDPQSIFKLISSDPDAIIDIAINLSKFEFVDKRWVLDSLVNRGEIEIIGRICGSLMDSEAISAEEIYEIIKDNPVALGDAFSSGERTVKKFGQVKLFDRILEIGSPSDLGWRMRYVEDAELRSRFLDFCIERKDSSALFSVLGSDNVDKLEIIRKCCLAGWELPLIESDEDRYFAGLPSDKTPSLSQLIEWQAYAYILSHPEKYSDVDKNDMYSKLIERDDPETLSTVLYHDGVTGVPAEVALYLADKEENYTLSYRKEVFDKAVFTPEVLERYLQADGRGFVELYEYSGKSIDWMDHGIEVFGREVPPALLLAIKELDNVSSQLELPADLVNLGVNRRGQPGIEQLRTTFKRLRQQLVFGVNTQEELETFVGLTTVNSVAKSIAKELTRFSESQWGQHTEDEWTKLMTNHLEAAAESRPLAPEFVASPEYTVRTIDAKEFDPSKLDEDAVKKYDSLKSSVELALSVAGSPASGRYEQLFSLARESIGAEITRLSGIRTKLEAEGKAKALENINGQLESLQSAINLTPREFIRTARDDFGKLSSLNVKGLDHILRAGAFARAIRKSPEAKALAQSLRSAEATYDRLVAMDDFVEHLVNNEVYSRYFGDDSSRKAFQRLTDTTALRQQISKIQNGQTSGQTSLQFVPTRGLLLELSGHLGDACWASRYESIAKEFPNLTAITYLRNPGKTTERLVGAGLIFETTDVDTGEDILVLRGTNPIENYINGVKVDDFFASLVSYAKSVAGNRKVAVVIDGGPGMATTNRPVLHNFLKTTVKAGRSTEEAINLPNDTTFNDFMLTPSSHPVFYID